MSALLVLAAAIVVAVNAAGAPARAEVPDPAIAAIESLGGAGDCFTRGFVFLAPADIGEATSSAAGWTVPGVRYKGTAEQAATAFGGTLISEGPGEAWIAENDSTGAAVSRQIREVGAGIWQRADSVRRIDCGVNAGDPR